MQKILPVWIYLALAFVTVRCATPTTMTVQANATGFNNMGQFCPELDDGVNVTCLVDHGVGTGQMWMEPDGTSPSCVSYAYAQAGYQTIHLYCSVDNIFFYQNKTLYVGEKIDQVTVGDQNGNALIPLIDSSDIYVNYVNGSDVSLEIFSNTSNAILSQTNVTTRNFTHTITAADLNNQLGMHAVSVTLQNPISSVTRWLVIALDEVISGFNFTGHINPFMHIDDVIDLNFTLEKGSDVSIAIEIKTVLFVQKCEGALRNHSFSYTLNETGSYVIELTLSNFVSTYNWTFPLMVQYPVHNFTVQQIKNVMKGSTDTWTIELPAGSSTPMGILFGVIEEDGNQIDNTSLTTAASQTYSKSYPTAGYFNITFTIQSEISRMVFSWIQVVENELSLELLIQESVPISQSEQEFVLRITDPNTSPLYKLNCTLDIDGVSQEFPIAEQFTDSTNQTLIYRYYGIGNKTVTVNCSNTLRNWTVTKIVEVWTDCFASANFFSVAFKSSTTPMRVYITQIVQITAKVEVTQLCKNSSREYWWDFYDVPHDDHLNPELRGYYNDSANQPNGVTITFAKEAIEAGLKKLVLRVNLTDQEGGILEDFIYVDFRTPPIVAQITGGSEVSHEVSANLIMDASSSKDPVQLYSDQPFDFNWTCFKVPDANVTDLNTFMGTFETVNEISPSSLGADCSLTATLTNQGRIEIPSSNLRDGFYFLFIVTVEKINQTSAGLTIRRNDKVFQAVHIVPYEPPRTELKCLRNCNKKINLDSISSFNVTCSNCESDTVYRWDLEKFNTTTNMFETMLDGGFEAYIETRTIETTEIAIKASVLPQGGRLRLKCDISWNGKNVTVSNILSVNYQPRGGECAIEPKTGNASITFFEIKCTGWLDEEDRNTKDDTLDQNALLTYKVYQNSVRNGTRIISLLEESTEPIVKAYLGIGDPSNDYNSTIEVYVIDRFYGSAKYTIPVQVNNPIASTTLPSSEQVEEYYSTVLIELTKSNSAELLMKTVESITSVLTDYTIIKNDSYPDIDVNKIPTEWNGGLLDLQDVNGTKVMASYDSMLEDILQKSVNAYQVKVQETFINLTDTMLSKLQETNSSTFAWVETTSNAFGNVLSKSEYVADKSVIHASDALKQLTASFTNLTIAHYEGEDSIFHSSSTAIEQTTTGLINLMNSLVVNTVPDDILNTSDATIASSSTASSRLYVEYLFHVNVDQAYEYAENSTLTPEERVGMFYMRARISQIELEKKRKVSEQSGRDLNDAIESLATSLLSVECNGCSRSYSKDSIVLHIQSDTVEAIYNTSLDSNLTLNFGDIPKDTVVKLATTELDRNIYLYDHSTTAALITSPVQKILADKTSIFVVTIKQPVTTDFSDVKVTVPTFISEDASGFFYHTFLYRNLGDYACFHIVQVHPRLNEKYDVYLRVADFPTIFQYDAIAEVTINRDYMACIPPQKINSVGIIHIGLKPTPTPNNYTGFSGRRKRAAGTGPFTYNNETYTDPRLNPYRLMVISSSCNTWNEGTEKWRSDSCLMDWYPNKGEVSCECSGENGLTFANSFYVAPNTIDFSTVFLKFSPKDQAAVLAIFILVIVLYVILMIWGRHQDKKDIVKWGVTPLIDNFVDDTYYYLITVYTGMRRGAGTRSRVGFIVAGEDDDTGVRELYDGVRTEFSTASVNHFLMATSQPLGPLTYLYIFHDNSGEGEWSSWYLNRVDIEDLQDRTRFVFLCGRWLSLDSLDCQVEAVLPVCGRENVTTFKNMFFINYKENLADNHLWVSIYFRPTSSHFTRIQRITCLLLFIMLTMIGNAVYFRPEDEYENPALVKVGPLQFSWQTVYISLMSTLISTPTTILVVSLFKKAKARVIDHDVKDSSLKYSMPVINNFMDKLLKESKELERTLVAKGVISNDGTILPYWTSYIGWFLAIAGSITSAFFIMLFSMEWGKTKTEMWLAQFFLAFFESACILDPLKVVMMAAVFALIFSQTDRFRPSGLTREIVLKNYRQRYGQEQSIRIPAPPLNQALLEKAREERMREIKMMDSLKQVVITLFYIWIIYSISFSNRDTGSFNVQNDISNRLLTPSEKGAQQFQKINTTTQYMTWLETIAFPTLFPQSEYNGERLHWRYRQYTAGLTNFRVGPPRLRQVKVIQDETTVYPFGTMKTFPSYNILREETKSFCFGWQNPPCDIEAEARSFSFRAWKYTDPLDIWGVPVVGYYNTYSGGGYIAELDVNLDFTNRTMEELTQHLWIDRTTRAVFFEFSVYNADFNLFTYCTLVAEFPEVGGVMTMSSIYPFRVYHHVGPTGYYVMFCEICFVLFLVAQIVRVVYYLYKRRLQFFKSTWFVLDLVGIFLSLVAIAMYAGRMLLANQTLAKFKEDPKAFVNFQHIAYWDNLLIVFIGLLVFLGTTRLLGILGYDKRIGQVFRVFDNCAWDLFWFGIFFLCLFAFYAILGYLLFGRDLESYYDIFESLGTLFISMIGKSKFNEINDADPLMAQFYFFTYVLFIVYFLLTIFLAILCESINVVHQRTKLDRSDELVMYIIDKVRGFFATRNGGKKKQKDFSSIMIEHQKPLNLLKELRNEIDTAMSAYSEQEDKDKHERMKKRGKEFLKRLDDST